MTTTPQLPRRKNMSHLPPDVASQPPTARGVARVILKIPAVEGIHWCDPDEDRELLGEILTAMRAWTPRGSGRHAA